MSDLNRPQFAGDSFSKSPQYILEIPAALEQFFSNSAEGR